MSAASKINKSLDWIAGGITIGAVILAIMGKRKRDKENGVGWAQAYASKKRIESYFDYPELIDNVLIDLTERKGDYVDGRIYFRHRMPASFWISKDDARWLSALCDKYDVEFSAYNGNTYIPSLHKNIVMDFGTEQTRLPRI